VTIFILIPLNELPCVNNFRTASSAIVLYILTWYARIVPQMSNFWDQPGGVRGQGQLTGKVGSVMSSTTAQHGGREIILFSGMIRCERAYALD
jgi:multimeric flavodoxin WrbA